MEIPSVDLLEIPLPLNLNELLLVYHNLNLVSHKGNILIFFNGAHIAYSPTVTQIYDELIKSNGVTILARDPRRVTNQKLNNRNVIYYDYRKGFVAWIYRFVFKMLSYFNYTIKELKAKNLGYEVYFFEFLLLKKILKKKMFSRIIAVDNKNLFLCSILKQKVDFLSLELCENEHLINNVDNSLIDCLIIQTVERKKYLFNEVNIKTFYIQNAPPFRKINVRKNRKDLIFSGTAWDAFGFYHCLNYLKKYPDETLNVQGVVLTADKNRINSEYSELLSEGRLIINTNYFENDKVVEYISNFEIGFCFYNFEIPWINNYNYITAPSGKLFKYLAAGVPVVAVNIIGFKFVEDFKCGILIESLEEGEIRNAVLSIRKEYDQYVENAIKAAEYFNFDNAIKPYKDFITGIE